MKTHRPLPVAILLLLPGWLLGSAPAHAATLPNAWQIADVSNTAGSGSLNYFTNLTTAQRTAATNYGWRFTVVSRLVEGSGGGSPAQFMTYGNGTRRFVVGWDTNAAGRLTAITFGSPNTTNILTATASAATNAYHIHDLVYDPLTQQATYLFDGASVQTWTGLSPDANLNGTAQWGSGSSGGRGRMNYHHVQFAINGLGTVARYDAGLSNAPAIAPHPQTQGWNTNLPSVATAVTNAPVSPDAVALPELKAWQITDNVTTSDNLNYTTNLSPAMVQTATNDGWRCTMTSRLVDDFGATVAMFMIFGDGTRRHGLGWDFNAARDTLVINLLGGGTTNVVVANAADATAYHTHELVRTNGVVNYFFDGRFILTSPGDTAAAQSNQVFWGSGASAGRGQVNFHRAEFWVNGQGRVAAYNAGTDFDGGPAPSPITQGWTRNQSGSGVTEITIPCLPTVVVTSTDDSGFGSLRQALLDTCPGGTITFSPALNGQTLVLTSGELVIDRSLNILGPGATNLAISGNGASRVIRVASNSIPNVVTLADLTITNGNGIGGGVGGLRVGGGILNDNGSLTVDRCTLSGNSAQNGGGINSAGHYGWASLIVRDSTLSGNSANEGGGLFNSGSFGNASLQIENCTFSGNTATVNGGGAIWNEEGLLSMIGSTLTGNRASGASGLGGGLACRGTESLTNCIITGNFKGTGTVASDFAWEGYESASHSLISSALPITSILDTNLAFNGGPTRTHALVAGSVALNAGTNLASLPAYDQRGPGFPRVAGTRVDVGAYEFATAPVLVGCPGNLVTNVANGTDTRALTWTAPTATGYPAPVVTCVPPSGSLFSVGSTLVTCTASNVAGSDTCTFTVTVCATNITVTSAANSGAGSLRAAISNACPGGAITFAPALNGQTIVLTSGELVIRTNLSILGPGATNLAISGNGASRVFLINPGVTSLLSGLTVTNGNGVGAFPSGEGGGIDNRGTLTVSDSTVSGNSAQFGGGILNDGLLTVQNCILNGNLGRAAGGGIYGGGLTTTVIQSTLTGNFAASGGGISALPGGLLTVQNSTLSGNSVTNLGGGLYNAGGTIIVENSTLSGNSAPSGGGINNQTGSLTVRNSTLSGNAAQLDGGGIYAGHIERLTNCIVAGNFVGGTPRDFTGPVDSAAYNLVGSATAVAGITHGVNGNIVGNAGSGTLAIASILDTNLAFNGGSTRTHALVPGSPALNAGTNVANLPAYDQRGSGFPRVAGGRVDIGAYELQILAPVLAGCPGTLSANVANGTDTVVVTWAAPTVTGNPVPVVTCVPPSGSLFSVGANLVTCTATNLVGTDTCTFTVNVCATNIVVTSAANSGPGSLRMAIANACPGGTITFDSALNGQTLVLTSGELAIDKDLTLAGPGANLLAISGNGSSRVFQVNPGANFLLAGLTVTNGNAIAGNVGGGGILNRYGFLTVSNCTISGNVAFAGGGIYNYGWGSSATLSILNSTLSGNSSTSTGVGAGAIYSYARDGDTTVTVRNCTISGNTSGFGVGGIQNHGYSGTATLTVLNTTLSGNAGTGIYNSDSPVGVANLTLGHTLLAKGAGGVNLFNDGSVTNLGFNLADDGSAGAFATEVPSLLLGPLAENGGPTPTHALLPGSPAIDAGAGNLPNAWQVADVTSVLNSGGIAYTITLTAVQRTAATNAGWHYTVVSRLVNGSGGAGPAQFMVYGNGVRRFAVAWDLNPAGQLTATMGAAVTNLTAAGAAATNYHQHELIYDPVSAQGTYLFDGTPLRTWPGEVLNAQNGIVQWGGISSLGMGRMNYHQVKFAINGLGTVAEYLAGFQGSPASAPNPTDQNWGLALPVTPGAATNAPVSPDAVPLDPGISNVFTLDFDQRGPGYVRPVGSAMDIGAFEVQTASATLKLTGIARTTAGVLLQVQGAPNEALSLQWNTQPGPGGWQPLTSIVTGALGQLQYTDTTASGQPVRFYRVMRP